MGKSERENVVIHKGKVKEGFRRRRKKKSRRKGRGRNGKLRNREKIGEKGKIQVKMKKIDKQENKKI